MRHKVIPKKTYSPLGLMKPAPDDISLQEDLLFFNVVPEKIISNKEAHKIALEILQKSHSSPAALDTLERIKDDVEARQQ